MKRQLTDQEEIIYKHLKQKYPDYEYPPGIPIKVYIHIDTNGLTDNKFHGSDCEHNGIPFRFRKYSPEINQQRTHGTLHIYFKILEP